MIKFRGTYKISSNIFKLLLTPILIKKKKNQSPFLVLILESGLSKESTNTLTVKQHELNIPMLSKEFFTRYIKITFGISKSSIIASTLKKSTLSNGQFYPSKLNSLPS